MHYEPKTLLSRKEKLREKAEKERQRRADAARERGDIPNKVGNKTYLTQAEKEQLVEAIIKWKDPLTHPTKKKLLEI
jgi:hypothetical protein